MKWKSHVGEEDYNLAGFQMSFSCFFLLLFFVSSSLLRLEAALFGRAAKTKKKK